MSGVVFIPVGLPHGLVEPRSLLGSLCPASFLPLLFDGHPGPLRAGSFCSSLLCFAGGEPLALSGLRQPHPDPAVLAACSVLARRWVLIAGHGLVVYPDEGSIPVARVAPGQGCRIRPASRDEAVHSAIWRERRACCSGSVCLGVGQCPPQLCMAARPAGVVEERLLSRHTREGCEPPAGGGSGPLRPIAGSPCVLDILVHGAWSVRFYFETFIKRL